MNSVSRRFLVVLIGLVPLLLACTAARPGAEPVKSDGQPVHGGIMNVHYTNDPVDFDLSQYASTQPGRDMTQSLYDSLLRIKTGPDVGYNEVILEPELAEKWEVSPDAQVFTFTLRKGLKFANIAPVNGREVTSQDVKWSYEYLSRTGEFKDNKSLPPSLRAWMMEGLDRIETPDPLTVRMHFKASFAPFLNYTANNFVGIMPREIYDRDGSFKDHVVGTGPFQLDPAASQKGSRWVMKKNANYWEPGKPYIDELRVLIIPDGGTAAAALQVGQLDLIKEMQDREALDLHAKAGHLVIKEYMSGSPIHLYVNTSIAPFDNLKARKALSRGIDRDEMLRVFSGGKGGWALAGAFPGTFNQDEIKKMLRYDPEEAKKLLVEAGYGGGVDVKFQYPTDREISYAKQMELLQAQLKKIGMNIVPEGISAAEYSNRKKLHTHTMNSTPKSVSGDVDSYLYASYHPSSTGNYDKVNDPKLTPLLEAQRREGNTEKRQEIVREAVRYLNAECYCGFTLYLPAEYYMWQPRLKNFGPNSYVDGYPVASSWLEK